MLDSIRLQRRGGRCVSYVDTCRRALRKSRKNLQLSPAKTHLEIEQKEKGKKKSEKKMNRNWIVNETEGGKW